MVQSEITRGMDAKRGKRREVKNNGERLIEICIKNKHVLTNTKFKHKDIHTYLRIGPKNQLLIIFWWIKMNGKE